METLPQYLRPGLRLIWIGYNPSIYSAQAGHYYARPGNVFWRQLSASGLVQRSVSPEDDELLMDEAGIGFTDLCSRPSVRASELSREEIMLGAQRLYRDLVLYQPRAAVFNGRGNYQYFARSALNLSVREVAKCPYGEQLEPIGLTRIWVIPNSSGLASKWHRQRLEWLVRLARELEGGRGPLTR